MSLQHIFKNSSVSGKEPTASQLANGELSINYHADGPFLCCKDTAGVVRRIAGVWVAATPPGTPTAGELWLDTSLNPTQLKIYKDGVDGWVFAGNVVNASTTTAGVVELSTDAETQAGGSTVVAVTPASLQSKLSDSTSTSSSTTIASSSAVKAAYDLAATAISTSGGTITGTLEIGDTGSLTFEGSSVDAYETLLDVVDPTADRTITLPDVSGTVITTGDTGTVTSTMLVDGTIVDADINASAAIALSKLATGALPSGITIASANITDGTIVDADVNASAAIAGTKISPDFGDQDITIGDKIIHNGDTNTAIRFPAADTVAIETAGSERLRVTSDGNVGVGTTSPSVLLDCQGTGSQTIRARTNDTSGSTVGILRAEYAGGGGGTNTNVELRAGDAYSYLVNTTNAPLLFGTNNAERARIDSSGRVGIGTTSPIEKLDIANGVLRMANTVAPINESDGAAYFGKITGGSELSHNTFIGLRTNGTERARIDSSGRLLVGTSSTPPAVESIVPQFVSSSAGVSTAAQDIAIYNYQNAGGSGRQRVGPKLFFGNSRSGTNGSLGGIVPSNELLGNIRFAGDDGTNLITAAEINAEVDGTPGANDMPGRLVFSTTADGASSPTERMRIDRSGRLLVGTSTNYQVGDSSGWSLQAGNSAGISNLRAGSNNSPSYLVLGKTRATSAGSFSILQDDDIIGEISFAGDDGTDYATKAGSIRCEVDGTPGANDMPGRLVFSTTTDGSASPTEAMRINSTQELLVGYTSDNGAYKLQVNSQIFATSATIATSDGRYKDNVTTLDGCADLIRSLRPVSFDWKPQQNITRLDEDGNETLVREGHNFPAGTQVGFIAQEVQDVLTGKPWLGSIIKENVRPAITDADGTELAPEEQFYGIAEGNLIAVLTSALKDALSEIDALKARVAALEAP